MAPYLYTFGYEGLSVETYIDRLMQEGVRAIVDVRELPLSRKKGFSKNSLREALALKGIDYIHAPPLGCPKDIRDKYRQDSDWQLYTRGYLAHLKAQDASVRELARISRTTTACLICFEADFSTCHRTYVARAAHLLGAPAVKHLTAKKDYLDQVLRVAA
jgi:uncharacterized protein (DUF488 family)